MQCTVFHSLVHVVELSGIWNLKCMEQPRRFPTASPPAVLCRGQPYLSDAPVFSVFGSVGHASWPSIQRARRQACLGQFERHRRDTATYCLLWLWFLTQRLRDVRTDCGCSLRGIRMRQRPTFPCLIPPLPIPTLSCLRDAWQTVQLSTGVSHAHAASGIRRRARARVRLQFGRCVWPRQNDERGVPP